MKITENMLRQIIRQEAHRVLVESTVDEEELLDAVRRTANIKGFFDTSFRSDDDAIKEAMRWVSESMAQLGVEHIDDDTQLRIAMQLFNEHPINDDDEDVDEEEAFIEECKAEAEERGFFSIRGVVWNRRTELDRKDEAADIAFTCGERLGIMDPSLRKMAADELMEQFKIRLERALGAQ
jgi:hypothetical protein